MLGSYFASSLMPCVPGLSVRTENGEVRIHVYAQRSVKIFFLSKVCFHLVLMSEFWHSASHSLR